jgi:hypothetical protein
MLFVLFVLVSSLVHAVSLGGTGGRPTKSRGAGQDSSGISANSALYVTIVCASRAHRERAQIPEALCLLSTGSVRTPASTATFGQTRQ